MNLLLYLSLFFLLSCNLKQDKEPYLIKYGFKKVQSAEFINSLMVLGFIKHGKTFYSKIYDPIFFENMKTQTLEHFINNIFYNSLSQKYKIKVTDSELEDWIKTRTPGLKKEDLIYTLKVNNFSYNDWKRFFRNQFIQNKILTKLHPLKKIHPAKIKKSHKDALYLAVISFEDELEADEQYKRIKKNLARFDDILIKKTQTKLYSWVPTTDLPFFKQIKYLALNKVSKPIQTPWGYILVQIQKKGKFPLQQTHAARSQQTFSSIKPLLEEFKKSKKLHINTQLLYSLKIRK